MNKCSSWPTSALLVMSLAALLVACAADVGCREEIVNTHVGHGVLLNGTFAIHMIDVDIINIGDTPAEMYNISLQDEIFDQMCKFSGQQGQISMKYEISVQRIEKNGQIRDVNMILVYLEEPLQPNKETSLIFEMSTLNPLVMVESSMSQNDRRVLAEHRGFSSWYSPYKTESFHLIVSMTGAVAEVNAPTVNHTIQAETSVMFELQQNIEPYTLETFSIRMWIGIYLLSISEMTREVRVSHWTKVVVEDTLSLENLVPKIRGSFSRALYEKNAAGGLPFSVLQGPIDNMQNFKYGDVLGGIFSYELNNSLSLGMRYPLFGGWKSTIYTSHDLSLEDVALFDRSAPSRTRLALQLGPTYYIHSQVKRATFRVVLPLGASNVNVSIADARNYVIRHGFHEFNTYKLPTVTLERNGMINYEMNELVIITYDYDPWQSIRPILAYCAFPLIVFALIRCFSVLLGSDAPCDVSPEFHALTKKRKTVESRLTPIEQFNRDSRAAPRVQL